MCLSRIWLEWTKIADLRARLSGDSPEKLAVQRALENTYKAFDQKYPEFSNSFFDEHYLRQPQVINELAKILTPNRSPDKTSLTQSWKAQFGSVPKVDLDDPLSYFLDGFESEIKSEPSLKNFVDSRALEKLYTISTENKEQTAIQKKIWDLLHGNLTSSSNVIEGDWSPCPKKVSPVGRNRDVKKIRALMLSDSKQYQMIVLYGLRGVGKTTLAELFCTSAQNDFESIKFYYVPNNFNLEQFYFWLFQDNVSQALVEQGIRQVAKSIAKRLSGERTLLVLDGCEVVVDPHKNSVSSAETDFNELIDALASSDLGSTRILITGWQIFSTLIRQCHISSLRGDVTKKRPTIRAVRSDIYKVNQAWLRTRMVKHP